MINVYFSKNSSKDIFGFEIKNHGRGIVCSAVSILSLNCCNCIEKFTDSKFSVDYNNDGGYLNFKLKDSNNIDNNTKLILNCLELGLKGIELEYPKDIKLFYKES